MNIIIIGSIMVIIPLIIALLSILVILFNMLYHDIVKAYKENNIITIIISVLIFSFTIGMMIIIYGIIWEVL